MTAADPPAPLTRLLRACARRHLDDAARRQVVDAAAAMVAWPLLPEAAEAHGLSPLVRHHLLASGVSVPPSAARALAVLAARHQVRGQVQRAVLFDIVARFEDAGIACLVLKGGVLAFDIYASPDLRPLRDLDLLVGPEDCARAQDVLRTLGFATPVATRRREHHHLPAATCVRDGHVVAVEIHDDAVSRDQPLSMALASARPARTVAVGAHRLPAFGHIDMLRHLCAHLLEPCREVRLLGVVDMVGYADHYRDEIDWARLARTDRRVLTVLSLLHHLVPLPAALAATLTAAPGAAPAGVGHGFPMLGDLLHAEGGPMAALRAALYPSEWWMRGYYDVPADRPLWTTRWGRHLWRLAVWRWRRMRG